MKMAVVHLKQRVGQPQRYQCLKADTKPTEETENDLEAGAILYVIDPISSKADKFEWSGLLWQRTSTGGATDVNNESIHSAPVNEYFHQHTNIISSLSVATAGSGDEYVITVANGSLFTAGQNIQINDGNHELTFPEIISIATNDLTLDRRIDFAHIVGTPIEVINKDMDVVGTMAAPVKFQLRPGAGEIFVINRILPTMTHGTAGDLGLFGNLAALTNGILLRAKIADQYYTFTNWKTNADLKGDMYDIDFDTRSGGGGTYGTSGRGSFSKIHVAVILDGDIGDFMEIYVQDDISALDTFRIKGQGHFE
jgi:hypothetical protein